MTKPALLLDYRDIEAVHDALVQICVKHPNWRNPQLTDDEGETYCLYKHTLAGCAHHCLMGELLDLTQKLTPFISQKITPISEIMSYNYGWVPETTVRLMSRWQMIADGPGKEPPPLWGQVLDEALADDIIVNLLKGE